MVLYSEQDLAGLVKSMRIKSGMRQVDVAKALEVSRPSVVFAENNPERHLTTLRIRIIEYLSGSRLEGPLYRLKRGK